MALTPITPLERLSRPTPDAAPESQTAGGAFDRVLNGVLGTASAADAQATQSVQALVTGQADDLHTASLAIAQADLSFRLALAIRNRLLEAFQEITRLQV